MDNPKVPKQWTHRHSSPAITTYGRFSRGNTVQFSHLFKWLRDIFKNRATSQNPHNIMFIDGDQGFVELNFNIYRKSVHSANAFVFLQAFLCRLRSIAAHRDHFVRRLSVCLVVTLSW